MPSMEVSEGKEGDCRYENLLEILHRASVWANFLQRPQASHAFPSLGIVEIIQMPSVKNRDGSVELPEGIRFKTAKGTVVIRGKDSATVEEMKLQPAYILYVPLGGDSPRQQAGWKVSQGDGEKFDGEVLSVALAVAKLPIPGNVLE